MTWLDPNKHTRRLALRIAIFIHCMGITPLSFDHRNAREYLADLNRQYESAIASLGKEAARIGRVTGRRLIRQQGLATAARDILGPSFFQCGPRSRTKGRRDPGPAVVPANFNCLTHEPSPAIVRGRDVGISMPTASEAWNCHRKLRHVNFLTAMLHASSLNDSDIVIYPCRVCGGLHVGHPPLRTRLAKISERLKKNSEQLKNIERQRSELLRIEQQLLTNQRLLQAKCEEEGFGFRDPEMPGGVES